MARTIYLPDGSREVLFCGEDDTDKKAEALERILAQRLGRDAAALFREIMRDRQDTIKDLEKALKSARKQKK